MTIIPLPDLALQRGHYLQHGPNGWHLCDAAGPIRPLSWFEARMVSAACAPNPQVAATLEQARDTLRAYQTREDSRMDRLLAISHDAACNPRIGRGFVAGLQAAHALLSGSGDLDALAQRAARLERPRVPFDAFVMAAALGVAIGGAAVSLLYAIWVM